MNIMIQLIGAGVALLFIIVMILLYLRCTVDIILFDRCQTETTQNQLMPPNSPSPRKQVVVFIDEEYCWRIEEENMKLYVILKSWNINGYILFWNNKCRHVIIMNRANNHLSHAKQYLHFPRLHLLNIHYTEKQSLYWLLSSLILLWIGTIMIIN